GLDCGGSVDFIQARRRGDTQNNIAGGIMLHINSLTVSFLTLLGAAGLALADATVDQQPLGPDGQLFGGSISPKGEHIAVFAAKGSHYQIIMDGVEGPRIDNLIFNIAGDPYRAGTYWVNMPTQLTFSPQGTHYV